MTKTGTHLEIVATGILHHAQAGSDRAVAASSSLTPVANGHILATYRIGRTKDSDDEHIEMRRSLDGGSTWDAPRNPFAPLTIEGKRGSVKVAHVTVIDGPHLIAAAMWIDRDSHPGKPLFNPETEGCLPMAIILSDSLDNGMTWTAWRVVPMVEEIGPPSLTNPILKLADNTLVLSIETNKSYDDGSPWHQKVVYLYSQDLGATWSRPLTVSEDPTRRIFYWDQRSGVTPDGDMVSFSWTYDVKTNAYLNIQRNISKDAGQSWEGIQDLGFADQASHPAILPDGRVVIAWVDRFGTSSIRARLAPRVDAPFLEESEIILYQHGVEGASTLSTGALLDDMGKWSFGLPYAEALPDGDVLVSFYAGTDTTMDCRFARLRIS